MKLCNRRRVRELAVQAIYSWQISKNSINEITNEFINEFSISNTDVNYFCELLIGVIKNYVKLDCFIKPFLFCDLNKLGQIEKAILRVSVYELIYRKDIPYKVIINEGIELAKIFGSEYSYKFINVILDKTAVGIYRKK